MDEFLTGLGVFIIGYINAYSMLLDNQSFAGPQTGNMIWLGIHLGQLDFPGLFSNLVLLLSFCLGCLIADHLTNKPLLNWTVFALPIWLNTLLLPIIVPWQSIFLFTFSNAIGICKFRKLDGTALNMTIHTGNLRFVMGHLVSKKLRSARPFLLAIFLCIFGAFLAGFATRQGAAFTLWVATAITFIPYFTAKGDRSNN